MFQLRQIRWLLEHGSIVICAGGGGIPTYYDDDHNLCGVEAVIDKDLASGLLAKEIGADLYVMATDADAAFVDFGTPEQKAIARAHPDVLMEVHRDEFATNRAMWKPTTSQASRLSTISRRQGSTLNMSAAGNGVWWKKLIRTSGRSLRK